MKRRLFKFALMPDTNTNVQLDIRCVQCGYVLRGITQPVCPECGKDYGSLKAMAAECVDLRNSQVLARLVVRFIMFGTAISNGIGASLMISHYWLAHLGNSWAADPKSIGLFRLPDIGDLIRTIALITWAFIPFVTILFATAAIAMLFILRTQCGYRSRMRRSDWCSIGIVIVSLIAYIMGHGLTDWLLD